MLGSISSFSPSTQGFSSLRPSIVSEKDLNEGLKNGNEETVRSESSRLAKKAVAELSQEEQAEVQQLKLRDQEVRAHEQAHLSAAGSLANGGASFTFTTGPNGVRYAVAGEVSIDTSAVEGDPLATIRKAEAIRRAALAPANPSGQDQIVASAASALEQQARVELSQEPQEEIGEEDSQEEQAELEASTEKNSEVSQQFINNLTPSLGTLLDIAV